MKSGWGGWDACSGSGAFAWLNARRDTRSPRSERASVVQKKWCARRRCVDYVSCSSLAALSLESVTSGARVRRGGGRNDRLCFAQARSRQARCSTHSLATPRGARPRCTRAALGSKPRESKSTWTRGAVRNPCGSVAAAWRGRASWLSRDNTVRHNSHGDHAAIWLRWRCGLPFQF